MALGRVARVDRLQGLLQMGHGTEVDRAVEAHDLELRAVGQAGVGAEAQDALRVRWLDVLQWRAGGAVQVEHQRQQHADVDGKFQVQRQRGDQGGQQHAGLSAAGVEDLRDLPAVHQAPGHDEQDAGHRRQRQVDGQRRQEQHDQQQEHRRQYPS